MEQEPFGLLFDSAVTAARDWRARTGGKVVGYLGAEVPVELIEAAGLLPVRLGVFRPSVVFWLIDEDQSSAWDMPDLTDALRERGIASIDLGAQPLVGWDAAAVGARLRRALQELRT